MSEFYLALLDKSGAIDTESVEAGTDEYKKAVDEAVKRTLRFPKPVVVLGSIGKTEDYEIVAFVYHQKVYASELYCGSH